MVAQIMARFNLPEGGEDHDDTSINGVIDEDTDDTPPPWDCDGDYPEEADSKEDDEEE